MAACAIFLLSVIFLICFVLLTTLLLQVSVFEGTLVIM